MFENYHTIRKKKSFIEKSLLAKNGSNWEGGGLQNTKSMNFKPNKAIFSSKYYVEFSPLLSCTMLKDVASGRTNLNCCRNVKSLHHIFDMYDV